MNQSTPFVRAALIALMLVLMGGLLTSTRAQTQICRDVSNINVCGDTIEIDGTQFALRGNIRIGPKGGAKVVHVTNMPENFEGLALDTTTYTSAYIHFNSADNLNGATDVLLGEVKFINDSTGLPLLATAIIKDPTNAAPVVVGRMFVDPVAQRIFLPPTGAVPTHNNKGLKRNEAMRMAFASQAGALTFYKDGGSVDELSNSEINAEFLLDQKVFKAVLPVNLKIMDSTGNPDIQIKMRFQWTETRQFTSSIDGFKFTLAGLVMAADGISFKLPQGSEPATFEAATVKVLKADNPKVPSLDPTDTTLVFAFTGIKYKNGGWSLGGVEVPMKDWVFGSAFKMKSQTIGIISEANNVQSFQVKSTIHFGEGTQASKLPVVMKIGRQLINGQSKPVFSAGLGTVAPKLGTMTFKLTGAAFVGDEVQDFFGIKATSAELQWPANHGGKTAAGVAGFELGVDANRKFKFKLGNGTVGLPEFENNVFKGTLQATIGMVNETLTITGTGTLNIKLPGNANSAGVVTQMIMRYNSKTDTTIQDGDAAAVASSAGIYEYQPVANTAISTCIAVFNRQTPCPGTTPPPPPASPDPFELKLTGFSLKLAGFGLTIVNPRGSDDGGFSSDNVALTLPIGMISSLGSGGTGIQVQGFGIAGNGNVAIQGGGFELAPITVGSVQFVGLKGNFVKKGDGSYEFTAAGKLPLPGIEPGTNTGGIGVSITVRLAPTGNFGGMGVVVDFGSPPLPPIPLGSTGMNLTKITGSFDLNNQTVTIGMTLTATSKYQIPLGALGSLPIAKAQGGVTAQFNPFKFSGNVSLSILIFEVANASVNIGAGQGFDGGNGMNAQVNVNLQIITGQFKMRIGKGVPGNPDKRRFAASATLILGIPANKYGPGRPPFNLGGIQANLAGGIFTDNNKTPPGEATGVKASLCGPNGNLCIGLFMNLGADIGGGDFLDFTNIDKYVIIPAAALRAAAAAGQIGYFSQPITPQEASEMGLVLASSQINGTEAIMQETVNIEVTSTTTLVAGLNFLTGTPVISLKLPDNTVLTEGTVNGTTQTFLRDTAALSNTTNLIFTISGATPGTYQLIINNAPAEYEHFSYVLNSSPTATLDTVTCGGADVPGLTVTCNVPTELATGAATPDATNATTVTIGWNTVDSDSPDASVAVGYVRDLGGPELVDYADMNFVAEDLPLGPGSQLIDFSEVGTGTYRPVVVVDDHQNGFVIAITGTTISVVDLLPPAIPAGLTATPQAGELLIKWDQNVEKDLAGYDIGFGLVDDTSQFIYTRTMGPKEIITGTNSIVDAKLWGLTDDTTVFYGLRAYDTSGNYSDWTPLQSAKPWAVSPITWSPVPNGASDGGVEIAFDTPMVPESLENKLTVKDASGAVLPGQQYFLTNADGTVIIGIGVRLNTPFVGAATATLLGGPDGAKAVDGRTMGGNYTWNFVLQANGIYMPLLSRE